MTGPDPFEDASGVESSPSMSSPAPDSLYYFRIVVFQVRVLDPRSVFEFSPWNRRSGTLSSESLKMGLKFLGRHSKLCSLFQLVTAVNLRDLVTQIRLFYKPWTKIILEDS